LFKSLLINWSNKIRIISAILVLLLVTCIPRLSSSQVFQDTKVVTNKLIQIKNNLKGNSEVLTELVSSIDSILGSSADKKDILCLSIIRRALQHVRYIIDDSIDDLDLITSDLIRDKKLSEYTAFFLKDSAIKRDAIINKIEFMESFHGETKNTAIMHLMDKAKGTMNLSQELFDNSIKGLLLLKAAQ